MSQRAMIAATAAAVMSMSMLAVPASAQEKEKCLLKICISYKV